MEWGEGMKSLGLGWLGEWGGLMGEGEAGGEVGEVVEEEGGVIVCE